MISRFECEDLPRIFLVSKFEINRPNIKLIIISCAIILETMHVSACHNLVRIVDKDIIDKSSKRATNAGWFLNCGDQITS